MAYDKLVDSTQLNADLTSVANAIRTKGGTSSQLAFPAGFVTAIGNISGGGGSATLIEKNISANGTYNASSDSADGYSKVVVSVPASAVDTGTKSITANGNNQDVVGYAAVNVNVPNTYAAGDEGKVVSSGALVAQTAHAEVTQNGTIDTTLNNSVTVNVAGASTPYLVSYEAITVVSGTTSVTQFDTAYLPSLSTSANGYPTIMYLIDNTDTGSYTALSACRISGIPAANANGTGKQHVRKTGAVSSGDFVVGAGSILHKYVFVRAES